MLVQNLRTRYGERQVRLKSLEFRRDGISIENCDPQSLEPRRGDMCKTLPLAGPFHRIKVILKSTISSLGLLVIDFGCLNR